MRRANPAFIPRNHRIEQVIEAAVEADDFAPFDRIVDGAIARPYQPLAGIRGLRRAAAAGERVLQTFCGT